MEGRFSRWLKKADRLWMLEYLAYGFHDCATMVRALVEHRRRALYITPFLFGVSLLCGQDWKARRRKMV